MTSSVAFCEDAAETPEVAVVVTWQGDSRCGKERKTKKQLVSNRTCIIQSFSTSTTKSTAKHVLSGEQFQSF